MDSFIADEKLKNAIMSKIVNSDGEAHTLSIFELLTISNDDIKTQETQQPAREGIRFSDTHESKQKRKFRAKASK